MHRGFEYDWFVCIYGHNYISCRAFELCRRPSKPQLLCVDGDGMPRRRRWTSRETRRIIHQRRIVVTTTIIIIIITRRTKRMPCRLITMPWLFGMMMAWNDYSTGWLAGYVSGQQHPRDITEGAYYTDNFFALSFTLQSSQQLSQSVSLSMASSSFDQRERERLI